MINLRQKFSKALSDIKCMEGQATDRIKNGSVQPAHFLDMAYYSGVHNAFNFVHYVYEHPDITDKEFDELFNKMMLFEPLKAN